MAKLKFVTLQKIAALAINLCFLLQNILAPLAFLSLAKPVMAGDQPTCVSAGGADGCFNSIQAAIDAASDGDTIIVKPGTYQENIVVNKLGLTITGESGSIIDGGGSGVVVTVSTNDTLLENLTIQNSGATPADAGIVLYPKTSGSTIKDNIITNNSYGIIVLGSQQNKILNNNINNTILDAIALDNESALPGGDENVASTGNLIEGNTLSSGRDTIFLGDKCDYNTINGNTIDSSASIGIHVWRPDFQEITNNSIKNSLVGIKLHGSTDNVITGNTITENVTGIEIETNYKKNEPEGSWHQSMDNNISDNDIYANSTAGASVTDLMQTTNPNLTQNWWGDNTGPFDDNGGDGSNPATNPSGQGNAVVGNVDYGNWLTSSSIPVPEEPTPEEPTPPKKSSKKPKSESENRSKACTNSSPTGKPYLFQIKMQGSSAELFFAPTQNTTDYLVMYNVVNNDQQHSMKFAHKDNSGVVSTTINDLATNTQYSFSVRSFNECQPGEWSNEMVVKTSASTTATLFYAGGESEAVGGSSANNDLVGSELSTVDNNESVLLEASPDDFVADKANNDPTSNDRDDGENADNSHQLSGATNSVGNNEQPNKSWLRRVWDTFTNIFSR